MYLNNKKIDSNKSNLELIRQSLNNQEYMNMAIESLAQVLSSDLIERTYGTLEEREIHSNPQH